MIPDYQSLMRPVLETAVDGEISIKSTVDILANKFQLTQEEQDELLPSGKQRRFANRVNWARSYFKQAGLIKNTKRGYFVITERGKQVLATKATVNNAFLGQYAEFQDFRNRTKESVGDGQADTQGGDSNTPDEVLRQAYKSINTSLAAELIATVREFPPAFFERLIVDLLLAMGYGGTSEDAGRALGMSGDNGVDGVIDQDPLGVDQIYIQAKRYKEGSNVGSSDIRDFYGSLSLKKANKGILVTTSSFSNGAIQTAQNLGHRIVLIDGEQLGRLMIRYNIGCRDQEVINIKKIDDDYFDPDTSMVT